MGGTGVFKDSFPVHFLKLPQRTGLTVTVGKDLGPGTCATLGRDQGCICVPGQHGTTQLEGPGSPESLWSLQASPMIEALPSTGLAMPTLFNITPALPRPHRATPAPYNTTALSLVCLPFGLSRNAVVRPLGAHRTEAAVKSEDKELNPADSRDISHSLTVPPFSPLRWTRG